MVFAISVSASFAKSAVFSPPPVNFGSAALSMLLARSPMLIGSMKSVSSFFSEFESQRALAISVYRDIHYLKKLRRLRSAAVARFDSLHLGSNSGDDRI